MAVANPAAVAILEALGIEVEHAVAATIRMDVHPPVMIDVTYRKLNVKGELVEKLRTFEVTEPGLEELC